MMALGVRRDVETPKRGGGKLENAKNVGLAQLLPRVCIPTIVEDSEIGAISRRPPAKFVCNVKNLRGRRHRSRRTFTSSSSLVEV